MAKVIQVEASREQLPFLYDDLLAQNPLLGRIEGQCRTVNWTNDEIRTLQLLAACRSNASLTKRLKELEDSLCRVAR